MNNSVIEIYNVLPSPMGVRNRALKLNYTKSSDNSKGWRGYRCLEPNELTDIVTDLVKHKLELQNNLFVGAQFESYFHYTTLENILDKNKIHRDFQKDYAGVIYLSPNAPTNSGTLFYDDMGNVIHKSDNIYSKLVVYPADYWHSIDTTFGNGIEDGRLTFTFFINLKQKQLKTLV
jgi:hypothetical protein